MFLKPFRVKTQTSVKSSDRKKLRSDVLAQFPKLSEEDVLKLIPNKEEMSMTKISTHSGDILQVYTVVKNPVFFESYKKLLPSIYTLWQHPDIFPVFRTWPPVFYKLQKGADLMLPGVVLDVKPSPKMFGNLQKGDLIAISIVGNRSPVAFGRALMSGEDMYLSALRGKGVGVVHMLGDELWEFGDKSEPPHIPEPMPEEGGEETKVEVDDGVPSVENLQLDGQGAEGTAEDQLGHSGDEEDEEEEEDPIEKMDQLFHFCFLCAIKAKVKKSDLPLLTGNLLRNFMQPYSQDKQLDVKKSSFKKFSKFLQQMVNEGYITIKQQSKGVDVITDVDKSHLGLRDLDVPEVAEATENKKEVTEKEDGFTPLTFTDVYCVNANTFDLFKEFGIRKGDVMAMAEARHHITNYITENGLKQEKNAKMVTLDPILAHTILKPSEGDLDHMVWEQVINRVVGKMQQCVAISSGSAPPIIKKGKLDPIKLDVAMRASQKKVTIVENLEDYGIDIKAFARMVQRTVASSCTVVAAEQKGKGLQLQVQGNQITFLGSILIDKFKISRRYVTGLDNAPKQKKKR